MSRSGVSRKGQILRIALGAVVIVVSVWIMFPRLVSDVRANGVVNTRIVTLVSPVAGTVRLEPPLPGTFVTRDFVLAEIGESTEALDLLARLDTEREALVRRLIALREREVSLDEVKTRLAAQVVSFKADTQVRLRSVLAEASARRDSWEEVQRERDLNLRRTRELADKGYAPRIRLEAAESLHKQAVQEVARAAADIARISQELKSAGGGTFLGEGQNDVPYSQQRLDEVTIAATEVKVQIAEAEGRLNAVIRQLDIEIERSGRRTAATIKSPLEEVVWRNFVTTHGFVERNASVVSLLDCNRVRVEIPISEDKIDSITEGSEVIIRLQGTSERFDGIVSDVRGPRAVVAEPENVAVPPKLDRDEVLVSIQPSRVPSLRRSENFCSVGRRVEVIFPGKIVSILGLT